MPTNPTAADPLPERADRDAFRRWLASWISSEGMRQLVQASGWYTAANSLDELLDELVGLSSGWEFRTGAERHAATELPADVNGRLLDEELVRQCAAQLGLVSGMPVAGRFSHGAALGGMARACRNRVTFLRDIAIETPVEILSVLTAHRLLEGRELSDVVDLGWGPIVLESQAALAAAQEVLGLPVTRDDESSYPGDSYPSQLELGAPSPDEYARRTAWFVQHWDFPRRVDVVAAPSAAPLQRRANTPDQLAFWAHRCPLGSDPRILLVTTDHYVPYQQLQALRVLGRPFGCRIVTTGTPWSPTGTYRAAGYLQEIRSTLLAAQQLRDSLNREPNVP